jgi:MFS family permease
MEPGSEPGSRIAVLRNRSFSLILTSGVISQVGDWALSIGLVFFVYLLTGSTLATGIALLAAVLPQAVVGAFTGVYVDRWSRRATMIVTNLVLGVGLLPLLFVHSVATIWIIYLVLVLESAVSAFFSPAEGALIPEVVSGTLLLQANSIYGSGRQLARLVGAGLGGVIVGLFSLGGVTLVDLVSFLVAAGLLIPIVEPPLPNALARSEDGLTPTPAKYSFLQEWRDGLAAGRSSQVGWTMLLFAAIVSVGEGVFGTLCAPFVVSVLHGSGPDYGWFLSLQAVGGMAGGVLIAARMKDADPIRMLPWMSVVFGILDLVLFNYPLFLSGILLAFVLVVIIGLPTAAFGAAYSVLQQTAVAKEFRGRYLSTLQTIALLLMTVGALLAAFLGNTVGMIPMLEIQGGAYVVGGVYLAWAIRKPDPSLGATASLPSAPQAE